MSSTRSSRFDRPGPGTALITGASSGIGRATAHLYAERGWSLVLCARGREGLEDVADECRRRGGGDVAIKPVDVSDGDEVHKMVTETVEQFGRVDVCVHSAAVMSYGTFLDTPAEVFDHAISVDLIGAANVARSILTVYRDQGHGHLVVIGSLLGRIAVPWMGTYVTAKWGLRGLTRTLQQEMQQYPGIHVSSVAPGAVRTPIYEQAATVVGRAGSPPPPVTTPEVIARAVDRVVRKPQRERDADAVFGYVNKVAALGYTVVPAVFDRLVGPLMWRFGISREPKDDAEGNVFRSRSPYRQ